jgi:hypothetical protein
MKKISITLLAILMVGCAHAQVSFYQDDKKLNNGDTITINDATVINDGDYISVSMDSKLKLKNESNTASQIVCSQHVVSYTIDGVFQFCIGNCTIGTSDKTLTSNQSVAAGNFVIGFGIEYTPQYENFGKATVTYTANLVGSTQKSKVTVIFNYQSTEGINTIQTSKAKVYQTAESLILECPTSSAKKIMIYNVSGRIIASYTLSESLKKYVLPKTEENGMYLYSVEMTDGEKVTGKVFNSKK